MKISYATLLFLLFCCVSSLSNAGVDKQTCPSGKNYNECYAQAQQSSADCKSNCKLNPVCTQKCKDDLKSAERTCRTTCTQCPHGNLVKDCSFWSDVQDRMCFKSCKGKGNCKNSCENTWLKVKHDCRVACKK